MENLEIKLLEKDRKWRRRKKGRRWRRNEVEEGEKKEEEEEGEEGEKKKKKKKNKKPKKSKPVFDEEGFFKAYDEEHPKLKYLNLLYLILMMISM